MFEFSPVLGGGGDLGVGASHLSKGGENGDESEKERNNETHELIYGKDQIYPTDLLLGLLKSANMSISKHVYQFVCHLWTNLKYLC